MAAAAAGGGGGAAAGAVIPENWRIIEVTSENLETLMPGEDKEAFLTEFLRRQKATVGCGYRIMTPPQKIENIYPERITDKKIKHKIIKHLYLLIDVTTDTREGYGVLALLHVESLSPYDDDGNIVPEDIRYIRASEHIPLSVLPAVIDWTCSFVNEGALTANIKELVKANLKHANMSVAKYITNEVSRMLLEEHRIAYPDRHIDGVILLSVGADGARPLHRRNGKLSTCKFLEEFQNDSYKDVKMLDILNARDMPISNMFNFYLVNGEEFRPGNPTFDSLIKDGADLQVRIEGTDPKNFEDSAYKCMRTNNVVYWNRNGGARRTRRRKQKRRKTRRR